MDILTWILSLLSTLLGGTSIYSLFIYRKQQKRFKTAEAFEKEVVVLRSAIEGMQKQVDWQEKRLVEMQNLIVNKDAYIATLTQDKSTLEIKHAKNKKAINAAYGCSFCTEAKNCPVLMQRAINEEEFLKEIESKKYVENNSK